MGLTTEIVNWKTLPIMIEATGSVQANPNMTTPVISLIPGRVESVAVQHGDEVKKGQLLAKVRSDEIGQIESELLAKLLELKAEKRQVELQMNLAQKTFDRKKFLLDQKIAAKADVEQAETSLEEAKAAVQANQEKQEALIESVEERLKLYGMSKEEIQQVVNDKHMRVVFDVKAPRSGTITMRDADAGELVPASKTIFSISDLSTVWLEAHILENSMRFVKKGLPVLVEVDSYPDESFKGKLSYIDSHVEAPSRTLAVRASIDNTSFKLKPDMFARMQVEVGSLKALVVPEAALQKIGDSTVVYVAEASKENSFREVKVETGQSLKGYVEVLKGLKVNDRVVVKGSLQLLGQCLQRLSN